MGAGGAAATEFLLGSGEKVPVAERAEAPPAAGAVVAATGLGVVVGVLPAGAALATGLLPGALVGAGEAPATAVLVRSGSGALPGALGAGPGLATTGAIVGWGVGELEVWVAGCPEARLVEGLVGFEPEAGAALVVGAPAG